MTLQVEPQIARLHRNNIFQIMMFNAFFPHKSGHSWTFHQQKRQLLDPIGEVPPGGIGSVQPLELQLLKGPCLSFFSASSIQLTGFGILEFSEMLGILKMFFVEKKYFPFWKKKMFVVWFRFFFRATHKNCIWEINFTNSYNLSWERNTSSTSHQWTNGNSS